MQDLNSLLENKQTPKTVKKCISASQAKSPRNTETFPARKHLLSPKGENKPLTLKGQLGQESKKPPCAKSLLTGLYFELLNTFLSLNLPSAAPFFSMVLLVRSWSLVSKSVLTKTRLWLFNCSH